MAFDLAVEPSTQRGRIARGVAVTARRAGANGFIGVSMIVNGDVAAALGWSHGARLQLQLGRGRDFGWARLRAHPGGGFTCRRVGAPRSKQLVGAITLFGDGLRHAITRSEHRVAEGTLSVRLPDWALPAARALLAEARRRPRGAPRLTEEAA